MSILMDALKQQQPPVAAPTTFWRNVAIALALLLAIGIGFIAGYLLLPSTTSTVLSTPVSAVAVATPAEPKAVPPASAPDIANVLTQATPAVAEVVTPPTPRVTESLPPEQPVVTVTTNTARAEPIEPEVSAELRERFASALAETADNRRPASSVTTHSAPAQDISMLDITLQRQLPRLKFEAHVYATQPAQRWVKVNGKSLQEGQWVTADVRLREITPHYVLLEFGQQLFSMRALSEW